MLPHHAFQPCLSHPHGALTLVLLLLTNLSLVVATNPFTCYANDFVSPDHATGHYPSNLGGAQDTVVAWANEMASYGSWSAQIIPCNFPLVYSFSVGVTNKPVVAPSGNKHDYMSWAP
jgi:hypothetical protein